MSTREFKQKKISITYLNVTMPLNILHGICFILFCDPTYADFFTALENNGYLLIVRKQMISDIYAYINNENTILTILKRYLELFKIEHEMVSRDVPNYLANPLNSFVLIKRLTTDLKYVKDIIKAEKAVTMEHEGVRYPNLTDLIGAVKGFMAIQEVYQLDVKEIAKGNLKDFVSGMPMTASDCYVLGRILFTELDPELAIAWMKEALQKYHDEKFPYLFAEVDIMEFIGYGHFMLGDPKTALQWTRKILRIDPNHSRAKRSVKHYKKVIVREESRLKQEAKLEQENEQKDDVKNDEDESELGDEATMNDDEEVQTYQALCRGDFGVPVQISSRLTCRYMSENHPFLKIAPMKAEMIYLNPDMVLFHEVLSDSEIHKMKKMAMPRLGRAMVENALTGKPMPSEDRISKCATMLDASSDTFTKVSRRIMHMTGLNTGNTKETQVANYGIGGYYLPHHDFIQVAKTTKEDSRRIATVLLYLSDVPQGGATVFTKLGVRVPPVKGTALFWYNLHASGEANHALLHGSCPIMRGSKWVATKWILQSGQELIKPCSLEYQPEGWDHKIPGPVRGESGKNHQ